MGWGEGRATGGSNDRHRWHVEGLEKVNSLYGRYVNIWGNSLVISLREVNLLKYIGGEGE